MTIAQISRQLLPLQSPGCIPCTEDTHTYVSHHLANFPSRRGCHQCRMGAPQALFEVRPWQCHLHQKIFPFSFFPHFLALLFPKATSLAQLPSSAPHCLSRCSAVTFQPKEGIIPNLEGEAILPKQPLLMPKGASVLNNPQGFILTPFLLPAAHSQGFLCPAGERGRLWMLLLLSSLPLSPGFSLIHGVPLSVLPCPDDSSGQGWMGDFIIQRFSNLCSQPNPHY